MATYRNYPYQCFTIRQHINMLMQVMNSTRGGRLGMYFNVQTHTYNDIIITSYNDNLLVF